MESSQVRRRGSPVEAASRCKSCSDLCALEIEALYSARNPEDYEKLRSVRLAIFTYLEAEETDWQTALTIQRELAAKSQHRGPKVPDLLIAAIAQRYDLTLIHYDSDFDRIAESTGQGAEWVVPRGSVG